MLSAQTDATAGSPYLGLHPGRVLPRELFLNSSRDEDVAGHLQDAALIGLCFREANYSAVALEQEGEPSWALQGTRGSPCFMDEAPFMF